MAYERAPVVPAMTTAILIGGPADIYRELQVKLKVRRNINLAFHRDWDKNNRKQGSLPVTVQLVIVLKDMTSHENFWAAKELAKKADLPVVVTQRKWAHMRKALDQAGFQEQLPPTLPANVVEMFPERPVPVEELAREASETVDMEKDLLPTKDVAELCGVSPGHITVLFNKGKIKATKQTGVKGLPHGSRLRFTLDQAEAAKAYVDKHSRKRKPKVVAPVKAAKAPKPTTVKSKGWPFAQPSLLDMDQLVEKLQGMVPPGRKLVVTATKYWLEK